MISFIARLDRFNNETARPIFLPTNDVESIDGKTSHEAPYRSADEGYYIYRLEDTTL